MNKRSPDGTDTEDDDQAFRAWDQYWRDGRLASCGGEGGAAYQSAITEGWREFFRSLPEESRILDVCTGNGAIARVAEEIALERGIEFSIDAFDAALIAPPAIAASQESMIHFRSRVSAESLPYENDAFDVVVGQYGLEYTDMARSLPELVRVSAPGGCRLRLVIHAREGVVVGLASRQLADARQVRESGIFEAARTLAESRSDGSSEQTLQTLKERYNDAVRRLEQAAAESVEPAIYSNTCSVLTHALSIQKQVGTVPVIDKIRDVVENVGAHESRLNAMRSAALDQAGARSLADRIAELWQQEIRVEASRREDDALFGWIIESRQ
ncbi:MAG: class I SAM-dependent methyltransferase [Gammaproteobacteria bacterium]